MKFQKLLPNPSKQWLYVTAIFAFGLLAYLAVLTIGIPSKINQTLFAPYSTFLFIASSALLYLAYRPPGWLGTLTSFSATLVLFASQLSGLWLSGKSDWFLLGGLLPTSDASFYYLGALNVLEGTHLSVLASWRPLFNGMLATVLGLAQQNLQVALAIFVLINAIACFFLAREIQRSHGTLAAVLVLSTSFMFYRTFIGTAMTENLGLALGAVGLAVVWRGAVNQQLNLCLLGIFVMTLALNARGGAFSILPALILWGAWSFRGSSRFSQRFLIGGVSVVLLGFIANSLVFEAIGNPNTIPNANFSFTFYGLMVGGNWQTIFSDHPELSDNWGDIEKTKRIYGLALEALRANPLLLLGGCLRAWTHFFNGSFVFSFVQNSTVNVILQVLSLVALFKGYRQRQTHIGSLIIASAIGIFVSVPFVPPWDAGIRSYAATIPVFSFFPAFGLVFLARKIKWYKRLQPPRQQHHPSLLFFFAVSLIVLSVGGPIGTKIATKLWYHHPKLIEISCPVGTEAVYFRNSLGSSIDLVANNAIQETNILSFRLDDFKSELHQYGVRYARDSEISALTRELANLPPDTTLIGKMDLKSRNILWIIADKKIASKETGIIGVCGRKTSNPELKGAHGFLLFYADSMQVISR